MAGLGGLESGGVLENDAQTAGGIWAAMAKNGDFGAQTISKSGKGRKRENRAEEF
jgi:hypothetical protein